MNLDKFHEQATERSISLLRTIADTWGEDSRKANDVFDRYDQILEADDGPIGQKIAESYLEWCIAYPARIGQRMSSFKCRCEFGWIPDSTRPGTHRPCPKCLPGAHDKWVSDFAPSTDDESDGML